MQRVIVYEPDAPPHRSTTRRIWLAVLVVVLLLVGTGVWLFSVAVFAALRAENNLHATLFSISLVERFVAEQGRWPQSWNELERVSVSGAAPKPMQNDISAIRIGGQRGFNWPTASPDIRKRVFIDFHADSAMIASQDLRDFTAIRPIGPCYPYHDYGFVESLQATLRAAPKNP